MSDLLCEVQALTKLEPRTLECVPLILSRKIPNSYPLFLFLLPSFSSLPPSLVSHKLLSARC